MQVRSSKSIGKFDPAEAIPTWVVFSFTFLDNLFGKGYPGRLIVLEKLSRTIVHIVGKLSG